MKKSVYRVTFNADDSYPIGVYSTLARAKAAVRENAKEGFDGVKSDLQASKDGLTFSSQYLWGEWVIEVLPLDP